MRKDELEDFIEINRTDFDTVELFDTELGWQELEKKGIAKELPIWKIVLFSAVVAFSLLAAVYANSILEQNKSFETIAGLSESQQLQRDEMILYVSNKEQILKEKNVDISELSEFSDELKGLDEIEQLIMGDFPKTVSKEKLVKSMLQYYESKARILELILVEIDKNEKNEIY